MESFYVVIEVQINEGIPASAPVVFKNNLDDAKGEMFMKLGYAYQNPRDYTAVVIIDSKGIIPYGVRPEIIGFKPKMNGIYAFNDILSYCNSTGAFFADIAAMVQALTYISHNIINLIFPKQIVLVVDSYRGIDIPVRDYIPNVEDPMKNIPDYDNKMSAVVQLLKDIKNGSIFLSRFGGFYLKMTINPAMTVINFLLHQSQNIRLVLNLPTIDNQILYDCEERNNVYPMKYIADQNPYWHVSRNHDNANDVLKTMQANYYEKLNGVEGGELEAYMRTYGIDEFQSIFPSSVPANELTVKTPHDLSSFFD